MRGRLFYSGRRLETASLNQYRVVGIMSVLPGTWTGSWTWSCICHRMQLFESGNGRGIYDISRVGVNSCARPCLLVPVWKPFPLASGSAAAVMVL